MRRRSVRPFLRLFLAAIAVVMLSATVSPVARASQEDCFVEVPGAPKKAPPLRRKAAPAPAAKPAVRVAADAAQVPRAPSTATATAAPRTIGAPTPRPGLRPVARPKPASAGAAARPARAASSPTRPAQPPAAKAEAASMRKVPVECAPKEPGDVRVRSTVFEEDAPQAGATVPRRAGFAGAGSLPA